MLTIIQTCVNFKEATYSLKDVIFCASQRFCEEVASSKDSHRSKMLQRLSIFVVLEILLKILNLSQIFRIVKMSMKILYLHWVEVTPQLCKFPGDCSPHQKHIC